MKYGFMLMELIVATLIASMIGSLLLTALYQGARFQTSVDTMFDYSLRIGIVTNQLEKDLMGAFIPVQAKIKDEKEDDEKSDAESDKKDQKAAEAKKTDMRKEETKKEVVTSKPAEKPLEKVFYSTNKGSQLDTMTFITNNPMMVFFSKDVGVVKPRVVRVQYFLKAKDEANTNNTFTLLRQESAELDVSKFGQTRAYELIDGIKECTVTYTARVEKKDESSQAALPQEGAQKSPEKKVKVEYEYKKSTDWNSERGASNSENSTEEKLPRIPHGIEIKLVLWDKQTRKDKEFILSFELLVDTGVEKKKLEEKRNTNKDSTVKKGTSTPSRVATGSDARAHNDKNDAASTLSLALGNLTKVISQL